MDPLNFISAFQCQEILNRLNPIDLKPGPPRTIVHIVRCTRAPSERGAFSAGFSSGKGAKNNLAQRRAQRRVLPRRRRPCSKPSLTLPSMPSISEAGEEDSGAGPSELSNVTSVVLPYHDDKEQKSGHLGEYFRLTINGKHSFFLKRILPAPNQPDFLRLVTRKEIDFYRWLNSADLSSDAFLLPAEMGVGRVYCLRERDMDFLPRFYYANDEMLVLEDLHDYHLCSKTNELSYEQLISAVNTLAKFHRFTAKLRKVIRIPDDGGFLREAIFSVKQPGTAGFYIPGILMGLRKYMLEERGDDTATVDLFEREILQTLSTEFGDDSVYDDNDIDYEDAAEEHEFKVICHGDLWSNNLLFNKKNECKLIDFQLIRWASPLHDLCTLLIHNMRNASMDSFNFWSICKMHSLQFVIGSLPVQLKRHMRVAMMTKVIYTGFAAATYVRRVTSGLTTPLNEVMAANDYDFIIEYCRRDVDQREVFNEQIDDVIRVVKHPRVTKELVYRLLHKLYHRGKRLDKYPAKVYKLVDYGVNEEDVLHVVIESEGIRTRREFFMEPPDDWSYKDFRIAHIRECYLYLDNYLMITEYLTGTHETLSRRQPFGLDQVQATVTAMAEVHLWGYRYVHAIFGRVEQRQRIITNPEKVKLLTPVFEFMKISVDWSKIERKLNDNSARSVVASTLVSIPMGHAKVYFPKTSEPNEITTHPVACKLTWEGVTVGSPVEDVLTFLYCTTTKPFRKYQLGDVLDFYYTALQGEAFGVSTFRKECEGYKAHALINACVYHRDALIREKRLALNCNTDADIEIEEIVNNWQTDPIYRERLQDVIDEFREVFHDCILP